MPGEKVKADSRKVAAQQREQGEKSRSEWTCFQKVDPTRGSRQSQVQRKLIWKRTNGKCYICWCDIAFKNNPPWEIEHIVPFSLNPQSDDTKNFLAACQGCNREKSNHLLEYAIANGGIDGEWKKKRLKARPNSRFGEGLLKSSEINAILDLSLSVQQILRNAAELVKKMSTSIPPGKLADDDDELLKIHEDEDAVKELTHMLKNDGGLSLIKHECLMEGKGTQSTGNG